MLQQPPRDEGENAFALRLTLDRLVHSVGALLGVPSVSVALLDPETGELVTWSSLMAGPGRPRGTRFAPNEGIAGWVAAHLEPALIPDVSRDARFKPLGGKPSGSMLCVPLIEADQLLGTLTVASPERHAFDARRQQLLQVFAEQAVLAISKTRQAEAAKAQARELTALLDATRALTSSLEPAQVFAYIVASVRKVVHCEDAVIYAYDEHQRQLRVITGLGTRLERLGAASVPLDDTRSIAAWVATYRRARMVSPGNGEIGAVTEAFLAGDDLSLLCVPLVSKDRLRGVIMLARAYPFQPNELGAMLNLSNIVAATLENARLYQAARAEREQQAAIYAAASDAIAVVDDDLTLIEANHTFIRLLSHPREEALGRAVCELLRLPGSSDCQLCTGDCLLAEALRTAVAIPHVECELPQPDSTAPGTPASARDDSTHAMDFSITPVMSLEGRRLLLVGRDITAYRNMEKMKANFLSMVSHELRAPLQTINGYLDLLLTDIGGELSPQQREFIRRSRSGGEHLAALVDDLLLISRRDAGQFTLNRDVQDPLPIIRETAQELELLAEDGGVTLVVQTPAYLEPLYIDGPRLAQVLRNLLSNAIKFTRPGGTVTLSADDSPQQLILRVRDTGIGIAPEHLEHIFERFYQVTTSAPRGRANGQGLGLAIVRIIVEGHGGEVRVESSPHAGSTFTVLLPRDVAAEHATDATVRPA
jgi:signal transduction histidine kinase